MSKLALSRKIFLAAQSKLTSVLLVVAFISFLHNPNESIRYNELQVVSKSRILRAKLQELNASSVSNKKSQQPFGDFIGCFGGQPMAAIRKMMNLLRAETFGKLCGNIGIAITPQHTGGNPRRECQ